MFCLNCGEKIVLNAKFCQKCGTPVMQVDTKPLDASIYPAPPQQRDPQPDPAPKYGEPAPYQPENANKRKSKTWIPIVAGITVLVLIFGALAMFTDIFQRSNGTGEGQAAESSRRREDEDEIDTATEQDALETESVSIESESGSEPGSAQEPEQGPIESLVFTWEGLTLRAEGYSATTNESISDAIQVLDRVEVYFAIEEDENKTTHTMLTNLLNELEPFAFVDEYGEEYGCFLSRSKTKDPNDFFSPLEWFSIGSLELAEANIQDYDSIIFRTPDTIIPFRLLENISETPASTSASTPASAPASASTPASASEPESAIVTLLVKNIYISMQGTGVNAVNFVEETAPNDVIYAEWGDWFENASFDRGVVLEGANIAINFQDGALVTELSDGAVDVTFVVDGNYFTFNMYIGSRIAAERTADGTYLLLEDETRALEQG